MTEIHRLNPPMKLKILLILLSFISFLCPVSLSAVEMDPYPVYDFSRDPFSIVFFREERPSFYWVNIGVPDFFFNGVLQTSAVPKPIAYAMRSVEYGVQSKAWVDDHLQLRATFPFEANALLDAVGNTHNVSALGDVEVAATYLVAGKREKGNFIGVDGWYRFATGTDPFHMAYPLLSTGKGAPEEAIGLVMAQEGGGFSFFQSIHYQTTQPLNLDSSSPLGVGTFQWPYNLLAEGRVEWLVFHRAQRFVSLYYELQMRQSGFMEFNNQPLTYGLNPFGVRADTLFFSKTGFLVRVDKDFSVDASVAYFPADAGLFPVFRPADGWLFSLSAVFRPI